MLCAELLIQAGWWWVALWWRHFRFSRLPVVSRGSYRK